MACYTQRTEAEQGEEARRRKRMKMMGKREVVGEEGENWCGGVQG